MCGVLGQVLSRRWGRKMTLLSACVLVFVSSALMMLGPQWYYLATGRFFIGAVAGGWYQQATQAGAADWGDWRGLQLESHPSGWGWLEMITGAL
jgi:MFS family permease